MPPCPAKTNVTGKGFAALREAGIDVSVGACAAEARQLLAAYIKLRATGRPWMICIQKMRRALREKMTSSKDPLLKDFEKAVPGA